MPKQLKKIQARSSERQPPSKWILRYAPYEMLFVVVLLALGLHVRLWILEFVVTFIPQLLIFLASYLLIYFSVAAWHLFVFGRDHLIDTISKPGLGAFLLATVIGVYVLSFSINIIMPSSLNLDAARSEKGLTIGTFNKLYKSGNFTTDTNYIVASQVDIFALQEVHQSDLDQLKKAVDHQYSYITECDCSAEDTEVALMSRYPIVLAETIYDDEGAAILRTEIDSQVHGRFVVYATHMHVPYERQSYDQRGEALKLLASRVSTESLPTYVVGDFNTSIYSPDMQKFMRNTGNVKNITSRVWPHCSWYGYGEIACSRIDYVFAPRNAIVNSIDIGREANSDHRSVIVELAI